MHDDYDRSGKWLIRQHGGSVLRLAGLTGIVSWRPLPAEVVQPRQLPDGLLEVQLAGRAEPICCVVEVATYPERRVTEQVLRDALIVYLDRRELPEVVTLVLHPKGQVRVTGAEALTSVAGLTSWQVNWRVVELWTVPAEQLLAAGDVGLLPWVALAKIDGPPEPVFEECRRRVDAQVTGADERANLLAVMQVLTHLRYNDPRFFAILGGREVVINSPILQDILQDPEMLVRLKGVQDLLTETRRQYIVQALSVRFGDIPPEVVTTLQGVNEPERLDDLHRWAAVCPDLDAFRAKLTA
jgi:hypothetical protein